jgi:hypothetical protein
LIELRLGRQIEDPELQPALAIITAADLQIHVAAPRQRLEEPATSKCVLYLRVIAIALTGYSRAGIGRPTNVLG